MKTVRGRLWARATAVLGFAVVAGCGDDARRFTSEDVPTGFDVAAEASLDSAIDAVRVDARSDAGTFTDADADADATAMPDASFDAGDAFDAARDVAREANVATCMTNDDCPSAHLYCNGPGCGTPGFCTPRPVIGTCPMVDAAVTDMACGCDGMTYASLCQMQAEGVRLARFGVCPRD